MLVAVFILVYLEDEGKVVVESEKKKKNPSVWNAMKFLVKKIEN